MWAPKISKWYKVDTESYKIIFGEGKERFEDVMSESESITNKAIKMLTIAGAIGSFSLTLILKNSVPQLFSIVLLIVFFGLFGVIVKLIFPKKIKNRGFSPQYSFVEMLDDPDDKDYQQQLVYYNLICMLQENITYMIIKNKSRARYYIAAIVLLCVFGISTVGMSLYYLPPLVDKVPCSV